MPPISHMNSHYCSPFPRRASHINWTSRGRNWRNSFPSQRRHDPTRMMRESSLAPQFEHRIVYCRANQADCRDAGAGNEGHQEFRPPREAPIPCSLQAQREEGRIDAVKVSEARWTMSQASLQTFRSRSSNIPSAQVGHLSGATGN